MYKDMDEYKSITNEKLLGYVNTYREFLEIARSNLEDYSFDAQHRKVTNVTYELLTEAIDDVQQRINAFQYIIDELVRLHDIVNKIGVNATDNDVMRIVIESGLEDLS
jgi:hypothetical protein